MPHEPRLTKALRKLLQTQRVAALGTIGAGGAPFVSMVPFALEPVAGILVLHISALASHSQNIQADARVSLMVMEAESAGQPVHALPRVTLQGRASALEPDSAPWRLAREAYLNRFPEAEPMTALGDFSFVAVAVDEARQVAGFGAARSLDLEEIMQLLKNSG